MSLAAAISVVVSSIHFWSCNITFELWVLEQLELCQRGDRWYGFFKYITGEKITRIYARVIAFLSNK